MFRAIVPAFAALSLAWPASAEDIAVCDLSMNYCLPLIACIAPTGEVLRGVSFGRNSGTLSAQSADGLRCSGAWSAGFEGVGAAEFTCSDGRSGRSATIYFEPKTGTNVGKIILGDGTKAEFWVGDNLGRYFRELSPEQVQAVGCAMDELLRR